MTKTESTTYERSQPHTDGPPPSDSPKQLQSTSQQPQFPTFQQSQTTVIMPTSRGYADSDISGNGEERDKLLYNNAPAHGNNERVQMIFAITSIVYIINEAQYNE